MMKKVFLFAFMLLVAVMSAQAKTEAVQNGDPHLSKGRFYVGDPYNYNYGYGKYIQFTKSNLIYYAAKDSMAFAQYPWNMVGEKNKDISSTLAHAIDLFGWGSSGYLGSAKPWAYNLTSSKYAPYLKAGDAFSGCAVCGFSDDDANLRDDIGYDWLVAYSNQLGEYTYSTLRAEEWDQILNKRPNATALRGLGKVNDVPGLILLPDNWETPYDLYFLPDYLNKNGYNTNVYTAEQWAYMEEAGAVFLPAAGGRSYNFGTNTVTYTAGTLGSYWTSSASDADNVNAKAVRFSEVNGKLSADLMELPRYYGHSVRAKKRYRVYDNNLVNKGDVFLQMDANGKATWSETGYTFTKPGTYYYTKLDAAQTEFDWNEDWRWRIIVTDPYANYYKVTVKYILQPETATYWTSTDLAKYIYIGEDLKDATNDTIKVKYGTKLVGECTSDYFYFSKFQAIGSEAYATDEKDFNVTITKDTRINVWVKARPIYIQGAANNSAYGNAGGYMGWKDQATDSRFMPPVICWNEDPDNYSEKAGWNFYYTATPKTGYEFVGWIPQTWLDIYGGDEEMTMERVEYLKTLYDETDSEYILLNKLQQETFTITLPELDAFDKMFGVSLIGNTRYYKMVAVFKEKPATLYKISVTGAHGNVYDANKHTGVCEMTSLYSCRDLYFMVPEYETMALDVRDIDEGYLFDYWKLNGERRSSSLPWEFFVTNNMTIEAVFKEKPVTYKVFIDSEHGTVYDRYKHELGSYMGDPCFEEESGTHLYLDIMDIEEGYVFDHWEIDQEYAGNSMLLDIYVEKQIVVKAVYKKKLNLKTAYTCDFTKQASSHGAYGDSWTYDTDWTVYGGANNNKQWAFVKMGGKNTTITSANPVYVVNKSAFDKEIKGVTVHYNSGSLAKSGMSINSWGVKVYSDLACTQPLYTVLGGEYTAKTEMAITVTPDDNQTWSAGYAIQVYWDLTNTSTTNGVMWVDKIEYQVLDTPTGIDEVQSDKVQSTKVLRNGQLYIIRDGKTYNAQGALIDN